MTEQFSPWARPDTQVVIEPPARDPLQKAPEQRTQGQRALGERPPMAASGYRPGSVTRLNEPPPPPPDIISGGPSDDDPIRRNKLMLRWFGGGAVAIVAIGLIIVLAMIMTGNRPGGLFNRQSGPSDTRPELAKRCTPPTDAPDPPVQEVPAPPPGPRTVDSQAGISYRQYGPPWGPLDSPWGDRGELRVNYEAGQHFVTEPLYDGLHDFHATILSGHVPAAVNDGLVFDLKCVGHQVAADVRVSFYPDNNTQEMLRDEAATLGGHQAWVLKFRLHYSAPHLQAKSELVSIALINVGRPEAAILYTSIPDTHRQFDYVADDVLNSIRVG